MLAATTLWNLDLGFPCIAVAAASSNSLICFGCIFSFPKPNFPSKSQENRVRFSIDICQEQLFQNGFTKPKRVLLKPPDQFVLPGTRFQTPAEKKDGNTYKVLIKGFSGSDLRSTRARYTFEEMNSPVLSSFPLWRSLWREVRTSLASASSFPVRASALANSLRRALSKVNWESIWRRDCPTGCSAYPHFVLSQLLQRRGDVRLLFRVD